MATTVTTVITVTMLNERLLTIGFSLDPCARRCIGIRNGSLKQGNQPWSTANKVIRAGTEAYLVRAGILFPWAALTPASSCARQRSLASSAINPRFSIITPVYNPPLAAFTACVDSVRSQSLLDWEWCVVDDCSTQPEVIASLDRLSQHDERIRVLRRSVNGGIVAASNDALAMARGEYVAFLDHDDRLLPTALERMATAIDSTADVDYVYSDETHVHVDGTEVAHFPKPDWCPERFRASMYTCHLSVLRRDVISDIGGFRAGYDGSQDHDLILRATELIAARGRKVVHVPQVLYHWRSVANSVSREKSTLSRAVANGRQAVEDQCARLGIDATVVHGPFEGTYRVVRTVASSTRVTVVMPTQDKADKIDKADKADKSDRAETSSSRGSSRGAPASERLAAAATIDALRTTHADTRLVVAYPDALSPSVAGALDTAADHASAHPWHPLAVAGRWSIVAALDQAFVAYPGDVLISIAPGLVPRSDLTPDWLEALAGLALSPGVGLVGSLIANADDAVVHGGWDQPKYRLYALEGLPVGVPTAGNDLLIERECTQVSLAAAAISAAHWREFRERVGGGGFDAAGRNLSDALVASGTRTMWTPYARFDEVLRIHR